MVILLGDDDDDRYSVDDTSLLRHRKLTFRESLSQADLTIEQPVWMLLVGLCSFILIRIVETSPGHHFVAIGAHKVP
jgi:hypothetical protein